MCVCVCMHACMYVCMYVYVCVGYDKVRNGSNKLGNGIIVLTTAEKVVL